MSKSSSIAATALASVAAVLAGTAATAQSAAAQDQVAGPSATPADLAPSTPAPPAVAATSSNEPAGGQLADIVITAERRSQSLQQVPISATVLNAADIARKGVNNVGDLQQVAPSVAINTFNRSTFINIRGVGIAQSAPTSNPGVAFYSTAS